MPENESLKELFAKAAETASVVPENMQEAAFHRALDALQAEAGAAEAAEKRPQGKTTSGATDSTASASDAGSVVERFQQLSRERARAVDSEESARGRAMALLRVARDELGVDGMSAPEIASVLTDKFRWRVTRQAIGQALDTAGRMVDRVKVGRAVSYRLMSEGERWLDTSESERDQASPSGASGGRKRSTRKAAKKKTASKTSKRASGARKAERRGGRKQETQSPTTEGNGIPRRTNRVGPKVAVERLIQSGYFREPRTIGQIQTVLEDQTARKFKPTDLSPTLVRLLRQSALTRSKNSDGQYEYTSPGS